jgi:diguanylate cyclase (GGDEF)-like protein
MSILDVDGFKEINDQYGHAKGDDVLVGVANILVKNVRGSDVVARWGGDEFVILVVEADAEDALRVAEKIRQSVREYYLDQLDITASIGLVEVDIDLDDARSLIKKADAALYQAKRNGKNCVVIYKEIGGNDEK